jgi:ATP-binding cassette subfamily B protein
MKLTFSIGLGISTKIFSNIINQKYEYHVRNSSSLLIDAISSKTNNIVYLAVMPFINLISSLIILSIFLIVLLINFPLITLVIISLAGIAYYLSIKFNSGTVSQISKKLAFDSEKSVKIVQETFGNIKEIIINNHYEYFIDNFIKNEISLRTIQGKHSIITLSPKIFIELIGLLFIVLFAYFYSRENSILAILPTLAICAFTAQKLLPLMQQSYASWISIKGSEITIKEVNLLLNLHTDILDDGLNSSINFNCLVSLKDITYRYPNGQYIFKKFNLQIKKNEKVCILGDSGKGKSTLINLFMGLINPQSGEIYVDGKLINHRNLKSWQKKIAHVPQNIFISDDSILKNITLGVDDPIDFNKIEELINFVELNDLISSLSLSINTVLGERGAKLSGGQKQKIGIARALYKNSNILIMDESTNSLDNDSEQRILYKLSLLSDKTIILITHKYENHKYFNNIIKIPDINNLI